MEREGRKHQEEMTKQERERYEEERRNREDD
jgi:hypothetical protein